MFNLIQITYFKASKLLDISFENTILVNSNDLRIIWIASLEKFFQIVNEVGNLFTNMRIRVTWTKLCQSRVFKLMIKSKMEQGESFFFNFCKNYDIIASLLLNFYITKIIAI